MSALIKQPDYEKISDFDLSVVGGPRGVGPNRRAAHALARRGRIDSHYREPRHKGLAIRGARRQTPASGGHRIANAQDQRRGQLHLHGRRHSHRRQPSERSREHCRGRPDNRRRAERNHKPANGRIPSGRAGLDDGSRLEIHSAARSMRPTERRESTSRRRGRLEYRPAMRSFRNS